MALGLTIVYLMAEPRRHMSHMRVQQPLERDVTPHALYNSIAADSSRFAS